ncbi:MAG TPA: hypothetical protein VFA18_21570 [Gemmataceae bacterium]|nr:hypothetical protein [Gemmataceae bacterium]
MNPFDNLMERSRQGDWSAAAELRQRLRPGLPRVVQRALAQPHARTPLNRLVREAAAEASTEPDANRLAPRDFVERVADRVCDLLLRDTGRAPTWCPQVQDTALFASTGSFSGW